MMDHGFTKKVVESKEYLDMLEKIITYIPQTSIIGRLLTHKEKIRIIKSTQTGIMQHDLYSWQLMGDKFIESKLTNSSEFIDRTITNFLENVDVEQRELFISILFEILNATEAKTINEIGQSGFKSANKMLKTYKNLDNESKEIMKKTIEELLRIGKDNIINKEKEEINL